MAMGATHESPLLPPPLPFLHPFAPLSLSHKPNINCCWYNGTSTTTTTNEAGVKYFIMRNMNLIIGLHVNLSSCVYLAYLLLLFLMFFFVVAWLEPNLLTPYIIWMMQRKNEFTIRTQYYRKRSHF